MSVVERYLELGLRVGKLADEFVESYHGPPEIAARVEDEEPLAPATLIEQAGALLDDLASADLQPQRRRWLEGQVQALHTTARRVAGEEMPYREEVSLSFGIEPRWYDEEQFRRARLLLDEALPGTGRVEERFSRWFTETAIPKEALLPALRSVAEELRTRTRELVGLPEGEEIEIELASGKRWGGFNLGLGDLRSRISINTDLPFPAADLAYFLAHEGYPGHHADGAWKEQVLVRERGQLETTMTLYCTPAAVLAEGVAELARELVFDSDEQEVVAQHLRPLGVAHDAAQAAKVQEARELLKGLPSNLALLLVDQGKSRGEARAYASRWSPQPGERIEKVLDSVEYRPFTGYVHCYPEGLRLCRAFVGGDPARFKQLLTGQFVPADLEAPD